ncbi:ATP-binding protein [Agaricicola taiwanensis]|uniref:ATP-binding protein n=1 Tax=Agaricicola taiwanensis TaxID=591372 RepID=UPI001E5303C0|nr:ATP-binding protein [Agaricicola taiwanensis]
MTIVIVQYWFGIALPLIEMATVIGLLIALNAVSMLQLRHEAVASNMGLFLQLLIDVAALTIQLYLSGGATNPFVSLFLLQVILGAVLLETWSTWALVAIASGCFIWLTTSYRELELPQHQAGNLLNLHIQGMFICFALAATLLVLFITRINRNLRAHDAYLADMRQRSAEEDHIVRMGLLASGAAHELGTPLATVSVILNDWRRMPIFRDDPDIAQEIEEVQGQLDRCKTIVSGILMSSGEVRGEGTVRTTVNAFFDEAIAEWRSHRSPPELVYDNLFRPDAVIVSDPALKQVLYNVFDNALEASPQWVGVDVERRDDHLMVTVKDAGSGFDPEILAELGKPYRSSKNRPGSGLGLFLVVNVVRKLGGSVAAQNRTGGGAVVTVALPLGALSPGGDNEL